MLKQLLAECPYRLLSNQNHLVESGWNVMWDTANKNFVYVFPSMGDLKNADGAKRGKSKIIVEVAVKVLEGGKEEDLKMKKRTRTTILTTGTVSSGNIYDE